MYVSTSKKAYLAVYIALTMVREIFKVAFRMYHATLYTSMSLSFVRLFLLILNLTYLSWRPFAYARIIGELEHHNGTKMLRVDNIQLVLDSYEIYYHILHSIVDTLTVERGPPVRYCLVFCLMSWLILDTLAFGVKFGY